jgi:two-component system CheB/CheR fusion protein
MTDDAPPTPPIVAIGGSAGGLEAFSAFFEALKEHPGPTGIAFVVLAHLPASGDSQLAELLAGASGLDAVEVPDAVTLAPDHIFVLPPGRRLRVAGDRLIAEPRGEEAVPHPIDHLFASLGPAHGDRAAAIVVSGTGANGSAGLETVREHGGLVLAQSPESAAFAEMPASAIATGLVDAVLEPAAMASLVLDWAHRRHPAENETSKDACNAILATLRNHAGLDFRHYKHGTLKRRIERRIHLARLPDARAYAEFLSERSLDHRHGLLARPGRVGGGAPTGDRTALRGRARRGRPAPGLGRRLRLGRGGLFARHPADGGGARPRARPARLRDLRHRHL